MDTGIMSVVTMGSSITVTVMIIIVAIGTGSIGTGVIESLARVWLPPHLNSLPLGGEGTSVSH
jgi:hypothetical protein